MRFGGATAGCSNSQITSVLIHMFPREHITPEHLSVAIKNTQSQLIDVENLVKDLYQKLAEIEGLVRERAQVLLDETLVCMECDVQGPPSLAAALQEGWTNLMRDAGPKWNYLGLCVRCQEESAETNVSRAPVPVVEEQSVGETAEEKRKKTTLF